MARRSEGEKTGPAIVMLGQRLTAHHDPIPVEVAEWFSHFPEACLSELCVRVERLAPVWHRPRVPNAPSVRSFTLSPQGALTYLTVIYDRHDQDERDARHVIVVGGKYYHLGRVGCPATNVKLIGWSGEVPVTSLTSTDMTEDLAIPAWRRERERRNWVMIGDSSTKDLRGSEAIAVLSEGGFVIRQTLPEEGKYNILAGDCLADVVRFPVDRIFEIQGRLVGSWLALGPQGRTDRVIGPFRTKDPIESPGWSVGDCIELGGEAFVICTDEKKAILCPMHCPREGKWTILAGAGELIGTNPYLRGYRRLPDGRHTYVGASARDFHECMVVGGRSQPTFQSVSPVFGQDGEWRYWGAVDRHLFLMAVPSRNGSDTK